MDAKSFVEILYESDELTFQTFSKKDSSVRPRIIHGYFDKCLDELQNLNANGSGVYAMVNRGDGRGRKNESVTAITSAFVDLDGDPLEPVLNLPLKPHIILATSEGRYQGRWKLKPTEVTPANREEMKHLFRQLQRGIASKVGGDPAVCGLAQLARVPGFVNHNHDQPFDVSTLEVNDSPVLSMYEIAEESRIDLTELPDAGPVSTGNMPPDLLSDDPICNGTRGTTLFNIARQAAYKGILDENLVEFLSQINGTRCKPPLDDDRLRSICMSVSNYWRTHCLSVNDLVHRIKARNTGLIVQKGNFYQYDKKTRQYRVIEVRALRNLIFELTKRTAGSNLIDKVLTNLADQVPAGICIDNPESLFISECIVVGGKAVLKDVYRKYQSWCSEKRIHPVSQAALRKEIERYYPGYYRRKIRVGTRQHHGFYGLSLNVNTS
ncbi:primase C-terminal domain-containing protein [Thermodesulfobacteriota bacterium]